MDFQNRKQQRLTPSNQNASCCGNLAGQICCVLASQRPYNQTAIPPPSTHVKTLIINQLIRTFVLLSVLLIGLLSCKENRRMENISKTVRKWTGKEIKFSEGMNCTFMGRDTTCIDVYSDNFKILLYVDKANKLAYSPKSPYRFLTIWWLCKNNLGR